jgi:hypothetical protein
MIVRDQTGQSVGFFLENTAQYGTRLPRSFPWDQLELLKMHLHAED